MGNKKLFRWISSRKKSLMGAKSALPVRRGTRRLLLPSSFWRPSLPIGRHKSHARCGVVARSPDRATAADRMPPVPREEETFDRSAWHGPETVSQHRGPPCMTFLKTDDCLAWAPLYTAAGKVGASLTMTPLRRGPIMLSGGKPVHRGTHRLATARRQRTAVQVLLLSPDGKLLGQASRTDAADLLRRERHDGWRRWLREGKAP
jgi:hypothetical protein